MKPIVKHMGRVTRVLSAGGFKDPFMCNGTCTDDDIKSYDEAFLMNIQFFLSKTPPDSSPDLMSLINNTFYQLTIHSCLQINKTHMTSYLLVSLPAIIFSGPRSLVRYCPRYQTSLLID